jgi:cytochrome c biogenesis protein CcmG, thiol:disulfide interchange protein DsbE
MTARGQLGVVAGVAAALVVVFAIANHFIVQQFALVTIGSHAPDFRAAPVGSSVASKAPAKTLRDYKGDVVLLNVWATWCAPCRVEMPSIQTLQRAFGARGLHIIAVSVDAPGMDSTITAFANQYGLTFEILHDPTVAPFTADGSRLPGVIERDYQTTGVPETFVIARDGVIRKKVIGADDWGSPGNQSLIAQLLREPAS